MASKKASNKGKKGFALYKGKGAFFTNKKRNVAKHIKAHPDDKIAAALKPASFEWSRDKPKERTWKRSKTLMRYAHQLRLLGYKAGEIKSHCFPKSVKVPKLEAEVGE